MAVKITNSKTFIAPMVPTLAKAPPAGPEWLHEVKFDGFRAQVHIEGQAVTIYSRSGADMTKRFRRLKDAVAAVPVDAAIIDCELVACDQNGQPDFPALMSGHADCELCLWCFDLLALNGERLTDDPLIERRDRLSEILDETEHQGLQFSQSFGDPEKLLEVAETMGLEGIVSKRRDSVYRPGRSRHWLKIKTAAWRAANKDRGELFAPTTSRS